MHRRWAVFATRRLRFIHAELTLTLYGPDMAYTIHVANCDAAAFPALAKYFDHDVRPMTCNIRLSQVTPQNGDLIEEVYDYEAELWLNGVPLSMPDLNGLLSLAEPDMPEGGIDFNNSRDTWEFRSFSSLTDDEKTSVQRAKIGIVGVVEFVKISPQSEPTKDVTSIPKRQGDLNLITSRRLSRTAGLVRDLVHQDEDEWRGFLSRRAKQEIVEPDQTTTFLFSAR